MFAQLERKNKSKLGLHKSKSPIKKAQENIDNILMQRVMKYGADLTLHGEDGVVHWHYSYNDNINAPGAQLHVTLSDAQNPAHRTWCARRYYTDTGRETGGWGPWVNIIDAAPQWAKSMANNEYITNTADTDYHDDAIVADRLNARYPAPLPVDADFPLLGA